MRPLVRFPSRDPMTDDIRQRALERLYERRDTVDELIFALENYLADRRASRAPCISINAVRKCS